MAARCRTTPKHYRKILQQFLTKGETMKKLIITALTLTVLACAQTTSYQLMINGQADAAPAIVVDGQTYVPLESLQRAGISATYDRDTLSLVVGNAQSAGGANQRESLEGCMGQDFFNGIWRVKVLSVEPITDDNGTAGWGLTVEMKNGSTQTLTMAGDTGIGGTGEGIQLVLEDETILSVDPYNVQTLVFASLPQGGGMTHQLKFFPPFGSEPNTSKPVKFLFEMKADGVAASVQEAGVAYSTPNPSLRVQLDCQE
jgi:hypothetical protein